MTNHDVTLYMDVFSLCFHVFFVQPFSSILYPFVSVTSVFIRLSIYNTVYRVYIFFGMYIWNFISLKGKWKFWFFSYYCYYFPLLMVFFLLLCRILLRFSRLGIFFFILHREGIVVYHKFHSAFNVW